MKETELKSLATVLLLEMRMTAPAQEWVPCRDMLKEEPVKSPDTPPSPTTARERVDGALVDLGRDYFGIDLEDIFITSEQLAKARGVSQQTARRHLQLFERQGLLNETGFTERPKTYELSSDFSVSASGGIESAEEMTNVCRDFLDRVDTRVKVGDAEDSKRGSVLKNVENGTPVRHVFRSGGIAEGTIKNDQIRYGGEDLNPSPAAKKALKDVEGKSYEINGWTWWEYLDADSGEWKKLNELRRAGRGRG